MRWGYNDNELFLIFQNYPSAKSFSIELITYVPMILTKFTCRGYYYYIIYHVHFELSIHILHLPDQGTNSNE